MNTQEQNTNKNNIVLTPELLKLVRSELGRIAGSKKSAL